MITNADKTLLAQLMGYCYVTLYGGDKGVREMFCTESDRAMAFSHFIYRQSLRDIEDSLPTPAGPLGHSPESRHGVAQTHLPHGFDGASPVVSEWAFVQCR